ncbi:MAG: hypothetical protein CMF50_09850 [Legionellales bacterium]|nr:hypothetical protein [Legionellales bacterium]|tara:strand:- start:3555 stop:4772 length:1218 start_codon:yes stop_codon:yes gene_type:complete
MTNNTKTPINPRVLMFLAPLLNILAGITIDLYAPSLPAIANDMGISASFAKNMVTMSFIGFGVGQLLIGTLADYYGRRRVLIASLAIYFLVSLSAITCQHIGPLMVVLFLQGMLAASTSIVGRALMVDTFKGKQLEIGASYLSIAWGVGPIIAPFIGGYLQYFWGWHANFYAYASFSGALLIMSYFFIPETLTQAIAPKPAVLASNIKRIFSQRLFMGCVLLMALNYSLFIVFSVVGPFLIQSELGYSSVVFGHAALTLGIAYFAGTISNRIMQTYISTRTALTLGLIGSLVPTAGMVFAAEFYQLSLYSLVVPCFVVCFAGGFVFPNAMGKCMSLFPDIAGVAGAIQGGSVVLLMSLNTFLLSQLKTGSFIAVAGAMLGLSLLQIVIYQWLMKPKLADTVDAAV